MNLFAYGTLLVPEIWEAVTGAPPPRNVPATLASYEIFRVKGGDFPGIIESENSHDVVPGHIYFDLPADTMSALDRYEDTFYERAEVTVSTSTGPESAQTYRIPRSEAAILLSPETWTLDWFRAEAMDRYCERLFG